jgi:hypothetical protein
MKKSPKTGKIENRGGAREGAGRKEKQVLSEIVKNRILEAAEKLATKNKQTIEEAMMEMVFDPKVQDSVKTSIFKIYLDASVVKESKSSKEITARKGPNVYLPESRKDPAKLISINGGKSNG